MKQIILITLFATIALLGMDQAYGQKVYKDTNGKVILDCSADSKMQQNAVTTVKKYTENTAAQDNACILGSIYLVYAANEKIYYKLEIAPQDMNNDGTLGDGEVLSSWAKAYDNCKKLNYNGTGWRLPTQRELYMIWVFRTAINSLLNYPLTFYYYWSATESSESHVWAGNEKVMTSLPKYGGAYNYHMARCVREL